MRAQIIESIYKAIASENELREVPIDCSAGEDTRLFGAGGQLDSLGLVSLIVAVEQELRQQLDFEITLASERAMSASRSPFASVQALANYVTGLAPETPRYA